MISIQEAGPREVDALRRRSTRSLAAGDVTQQEWSDICSLLDQLDNKLTEIKERRARVDRGENP